MSVTLAACEIAALFSRRTILMGKLLNFEYSTIHGTYWMYYGIMTSFASVFLLGVGYSNAQIGTILAVGNVVAAVLQPIVADIADRSKRITLTGILELLIILLMAMTALLFVFRKESMALSILYVMLVGWLMIVQPLINSLNFKLQECGYHVNFGLTRSMGSLAYAVMCAIMGYIVEAHGIMTLPLTGEVILVMFMISVILTRNQYVKAKKANFGDAEPSAAEAEAARGEDIDLKSFVARNKMFIVMNVGVVGIFFSNAVLNSFMIQIAENIGGNSADMGTIMGFMAFLEIPAMVYFDRLNKKVSCATLLKISSIGFTAKILACFLSTSVTMLVASMSLQVVSFGLFLPAIVHYINEIMSKGEAVKGQAFYTTMVTVTTVFANFAGGFILDASGVWMLLLVSTILTAIGTGIMIITVDKIGKHEEEQ